MINITNKADCVGCRGCEQICPKQCISMIEDEQGFKYPKVNLSECIDCGLCEKVCPVIHQSESRKPLAVYAARNISENVQYHSSSGGVFYALARAVIEDGGVVFGAKFDKDWEVVHDFTETVEGIKLFQRSKYVQSNIGDSYEKVKGFLVAGRKVLFTGTPCQVAGLLLYLKKDYEGQLFTMDLVCHGVPSPKIWTTYLDSLLRRLGARKNSDCQSTLTENMPVVTGINFRDKKLGWKKYGLSVHAVARQGDQNTDSQSSMNISEEQELFFEPHYENLYMQGFLNDLYLRPSCYTCPAKCGKSRADITLADFWGIDKTCSNLYKEEYFSLVLVGNNQGKIIIKNGNLLLGEVEYQSALSGNPSIERSAVRPKQYEKFWEEYLKQGLPIIAKTVRSMRLTLIRRIIRKIRRTFISCIKKI